MNDTQISFEGTWLYKCQLQPSNQAPANVYASHCPNELKDKQRMVLWSKPLGPATSEKERESMR